MDISRRTILKTGLAAGAALVTCPAPALAQSGRGSDIEVNDRVFITNEDSNTMAVIDPRSNTVDTTINLTSFDEDPRPPFRFVTGGVMPTHAAMILKPLYHGATTAEPVSDRLDDGIVRPPDTRTSAPNRLLRPN